jgi:hypothetical protein
MFEVEISVISQDSKELDSCLLMLHRYKISNSELAFFAQLQHKKVSSKNLSRLFCEFEVELWVGRIFFLLYDFRRILAGFSRILAIP